MSEEYRCHFRGRSGQPDIVFPRGSGPEGAGAWFSSYFEEEVRRGTRFRSGEIVQAGWYVLKLQQNEVGDLVVFEPKFGVTPVEWEPGAGNAYRFILLQKEVCKQFEVEMSFPLFSQSGVISPKFIEGSQEFEMERDAEAGHDSGWVFCESGCDRTAASHCSLFEIAVNVKAVIPFLALPTWSFVRRDHRYVEVESFGLTLTSQDNDFLGSLVQSPFFD